MLCGIEACLNFRPLAPLHDDLDSLDALTPGHFLTGSSLLAFPMQVDFENPCRITDRWKQITFCVLTFWKKLKEEYLVLFRTPNTSSVNWLLGRVLEIFPGKDQRVGVVNGVI